jgi:hypothetical protein
VGISLKGTVITTDKTANHPYCQQKVSNRKSLLLGHKGDKIPDSAKDFLNIKGLINLLLFFLSKPLRKY